MAGSVEVKLYSFLNLGTRWRCGKHDRSWPLYHWEEFLYLFPGSWLVRGVSLEGCGKSQSIRVRISTLSIRNESLYWLRYTGGLENQHESLNMLVKAKLLFIFPQMKVTPSVLGAFVKLWNAIISFLMSVHLSVRMEQLESHWESFHESFYETQHLGIFLIPVKKIRVAFKSDNNNGHFTWRPLYIYDYISLISS